MADPLLKIWLETATPAWGCLGSACPRGYLGARATPPPPWGACGGLPLGLGTSDRARSKTSGRYTSNSNGGCEGRLGHGLLCPLPGPHTPPAPWVSLPHPQGCTASPELWSIAILKIKPQARALRMPGSAQDAQLPPIY